MSEGAEGARGDKPAHKTRVGDLEIDYSFHEVNVEGVPAALTATEFQILALLAENPGEVFTRSHLLDRLGDDSEITNARSTVTSITSGRRSKKIRAIRRTS